MQRIRVREVRCKTLLHKLDYMGSSEFTANFYKGCTHGCVYCYVPSLIHDERAWGTFVDAKVNAPQVLARELRNVERQVVFLSSATDPYQPVEARYRITRKCLEVLLREEFPVSILTRSPLVLRDLEILKKFQWVRVGFSISTVPERFYEPGVVPLERRIDALRTLSAAGILTWVSMAPVIPGLILTDIGALLGRLKEAGVASVSAGLLRFEVYEESRRMFEAATGIPSSSLMTNGDETLAHVREMISASGLDHSESIFSWKEINGIQGLDKFL